MAASPDEINEYSSPPLETTLLQAGRDYSKNQLGSSFSREVGGKPNTLPCNPTCSLRGPSWIPLPPPPPCSPSFFIRKQLINPNPVRGSADNECNKNTRANNNSELERNMLRGLPSPRNAPPFSPPSTLHPRPRYHCLSSAGWGDLRGRATKRRDCLHNIIRRRSRPRDLEHHRA